VDRTEPDWRFWRRDQPSLHNAACLLCNVEPIEPKITSRSGRYAEWANFKHRIGIIEQQLLDSGIVRSKERIETIPTSPLPDAIYSGNPYLDGRPDVPEGISPEGASKQHKTVIKYVGISDLIEFANSHNYIEAYSGLSGQDEKQPKEPVSLSTLYKMILSMAIKNYGYQIDSDKNQKATGDQNGSIAFDVKELNLPLTGETVKETLKHAADHEVQQQGIKKTLEDWIKG